jgi:transcriptional regulator with XRE-family HTH domain
MMKVFRHTETIVSYAKNSKDAVLGMPHRAPTPVTREHELVTTLTHRRQLLGLSYADVANRTGLHRTAISLIERGERHMTLLVFLKLCMALDVDPTDLFRTLSAAPMQLGMLQTTPRLLHEDKRPSLQPKPKKKN